MPSQGTVVQGPFILIDGKLSRPEIVRKVVSTFISTEGGYWKTGAKFRYPVENLSIGTQLFILRPPGLRKWNFDFKVEVLAQFGLGKGTHADVVHDVTLKKDEAPQARADLRAALKELHDCTENDVDSLLNKHPLLATCRVGTTPDIVLKVIKWMFIMEDVVYWSYKGRSKLYDEGFGDL